jgi:hypothetical protein
MYYKAFFLKGLRRRGYWRRFSGTPCIWRRFAKEACKKILRECMQKDL